MNHRRRIIYADDDRESTGMLIRLRAPLLLLGLFLGIAITFVTSQFEKVLSTHVQIAFFLPFIVYMADALGGQTGAIYARDLKSGKAQFHNYLIKETFLGLILGVVFGIISAIVVLLWLKSTPIAMSVGLSMFVSTTTAPLVALLITQLLQDAHEDPAVGTGPIATVIQDMISVVIYGLIASAIIL